MTIDEALEALELADNALPKQAMQYLLDTWEHALPALLHRLDAYNSGADKSDGNTDAIFFILHLCAEKAETRAFPEICRLLLNAGKESDILGDSVYETLPGILIQTFDGNTAALKAIVEGHGEMDGDIRCAAQTAMAYLARLGRIDDAEMHSYMLELYDRMQPRDSDIVWWTWVDNVACLGYADLSPQVESLFERGFIDDTWMKLRHFHEDLATTAADPTGMATFANRDVAPFTDAIGTLGGWYGFSAAAQREKLRIAERDARLSRNETAPRAHRNIGRNEPCPCGSGKKYKKCCLLAA